MEGLVPQSWNFSTKKIYMLWKKNLENENFEVAAPILNCDLKKKNYFFFKKIPLFSAKIFSNNSYLKQFTPKEMGPEVLIFPNSKFPTYF